MSKVYNLKGAKWFMNPSYFVDHIGLEVKYTLEERTMGVFYKTELYWYFNGFLALGVI